jgi:hypothetical protein
MMEPEKSSKRLNAHVIAVDELLRPGRNFTNDWRRIADLWCVIAWVFKNRKRGSLPPLHAPDDR